MTEYEWLLQFINARHPAAMNKYHQLSKQAANCPTVPLLQMIYNQADEITLLPNKAYTKHFAADYNHNKYRCEIIENIESGVISSVIGMKSYSDQIFGQIQHFALCEFNGISIELAYVRWLGIGVPYSHNSKILYIDTTRQQPLYNPFVHITDLSKPLLHAWEDDCLWILNYDN